MGNNRILLAVFAACLTASCVPSRMFDEMKTSKLQCDEENAKLKAEIKKSHDDIVAQAFNPRGGFAYVPSQATDNVVKEGDSLAQAKPVVDGQFFTSMGLATPGK